MTSSQNRAADKRIGTTIGKYTVESPQRLSLLPAPAREFGVLDLQLPATLAPSAQTPVASWPATAGAPNAAATLPSVAPPAREPPLPSPAAASQLPPSLTPPATLASKRDEVVRDSKVAGSPPTEFEPAKQTEPGKAVQRSRPWAVAAGASLLLAAGLAFALLRRQHQPTPAEKAPEASATLAVGCLSHARCAEELAGPARCRKGVCVPLTRSNCKLLADPGDADNDATLFIGAMYDQASSFDAADLARRDFSAVAGGLPPQQPTGPRRPLALIACQDDDGSVATAKFLVEGVGVPVVLGFPVSREALELSTSIFQPQHVVALAGNQSTLLSALPRPSQEPRMLYRVSPSADDFAREMAAVVERSIVPRLAARTPRVALVRVENHTGVSYADLFSNKLKLDGRSLLELGSDYLQVVASTPEEMGPSGERLLAFRPNVVLLTSGGIELINAVEAAWPAKEPRPYWVSLGVFTNEEATKLEATLKLEDRTRQDFKPLNQRIVGVDTRSGHPALLRFVARLNEVKHPPITRFEAIGFPYDSFYLAAYLLAASKEDPSNGLSLVKELPRLASGPSVDVGQAGILSVFDALARGDSINLEGATSSLDFNYETGDPKVELVPFCIRQVGAGPTARLQPAEVTSADECLGPR